MALISQLLSPLLVAGTMEFDNEVGRRLRTGRRFCAAFAGTEQESQ